MAYKLGLETGANEKSSLKYIEKEKSKLRKLLKEKVEKYHHDDLETLIQSKLKTYVWRLALILEIIE